MPEDAYKVGDLVKTDEGLYGIIAKPVMECTGWALVAFGDDSLESVPTSELSLVCLPGGVTIQNFREHLKEYLSV